MGRVSIRGEAPRNRQQEILTAATALFAEKGIDQTSLDEVAGRVGVTKPTLYHYYRSKEAICEDIFRRLAFNAGAVREVLAAHDSLSEKLNAVAYQYLKIMKTPPSLAGIIAQRAFGSLSVADDPLRRLFVAHLDGRVKEISRAIVDAEPGIDPRTAKKLTSQLMHSLTNYWLVEHFLRRRVPSDAAISRYAEEAVELVLLGVRNAS